MLSLVQKDFRAVHRTAHAAGLWRVSLTHDLKTFAKETDWLTGWQHGHSLIRLGLLVIFLIDHDWKAVPHRGFAAGYTLQTRKSIGRSGPSNPRG